MITTVLLFIHILAITV